MGKDLVLRDLRHRYFYIPIGMLLALGFIFPGATLLFKWVLDFSPPGDQFARCPALPPELSGSVIFCTFLLVLIWPVFFRRFNSALYVMAYSAVYAIAVMAWFFMGILGVVLCTPLPHVETVFPLLNSFYLVLAAIGFLIYFRGRIPKIVDANKNKWDFDRMRYSVLAPVLPVTRTKSPDLAPILIMALVALVVGPKVIDYIDREVLSATVISDWAGVFIGLFVVYAVLFYAVGESYSIWYVRQRCKVVGKKMAVKEFSGETDY